MFKSKYYLMADHSAQSYQNEGKIGTYTYDKDYDIYDNAVILPILRFSNPALNKGMPLNYGGVCDENFNFIAGSLYTEKSNGYSGLECARAYKPTDIFTSEEPIIYAGIINNHFGHLITDSMPRMWYAVRNANKNIKVAILLNPYFGWSEWKFEGSYHQKLFELFGLETDRIIIVDKPTKFKSVVVPKQSVYWFGNRYNTELLNVIYDKARNSVTPKNDKKIYLSRRLWTKPLLNEEYFEAFFSSRGYKIIHPQELPLEEQVAYIAGADEIACTYGTLTHYALFAKPGTKLIGLLRSSASIHGHQQIVDDLKKLDSVYIDTSFNILPLAHLSQFGVLAPTVQWLNFINKEYQLSKQSDIFNDLNVSNFKLGDYLKLYLQYASTQYLFTHTYGFKFNHIAHLKSLYGILDPFNVNKLAQAVRITDNPLFRDKYFIYKRQNTNLKCMIKLLASGNIWVIDIDELNIEKSWSYLQGRLYFLNKDLTPVVEFVIEDTELQKASQKYQGVVCSKVTEICTLKPVIPGRVRNWIIKHTIKFLVNKKGYKQLKKHPDKFFSDSKNPFIRFLGQYYIRGTSTVIYYWRKKFQDYFDTHDMKQKVANLKDGMDEASISYVDNFMKLSRYWYKSTHVGSQRPVHEQLKHKEYREFKKTFKQPFPDILRINPYYFFDNYGLADLPEEVLSSIDGKVIIDGGGLNGDTALTFHHHFPNSEIHVYEPLEHYVDIINKFLAEDNCNYKIKPINKGLGDNAERKFIRFMAGANLADITTIDTEYKDRQIGLIKLDTEGMETSIIKGAERVIERDKPVLAIAIYHRPEDFFELKDKIKLLNSGYKFMIRKSEPSLPQADLVLIAY